jgi:hypothetical protein
VFKEEKDVEKTKGKESMEERKKQLATKQTNKQKNKLPPTSKGKKNEPVNQNVTFLLMTLQFL